MTSDSPFERVLELARKDDPACGPALQAFQGEELVGELMVLVWQTGTAAGRAALEPLLAAPWARGRWQGAKRIYKLAEAGDAGAFVELAATIDRQRGPTHPVSWRTLLYLRRRSYRWFKRRAQVDPAGFLADVGRLLPRYEPEEPSGLLDRLLRLPALVGDPGDGPGAARFAPALENPFAVGAEDEATPTDLLGLDDAALLRPAPPPTPTVADAAPPPPRRWRGPIFAELWVRDPAWLVDLLLRVRHATAARALVRLLHERVGARLLEVPLERCYALLAHPADAAWRFGLAQVAQRARRELLRADELVPLLRRAFKLGRAPDWAVIADVLWALDDERADVAREGLAEPLLDLVVGHDEAAGIGPVVDFLRRRLPHRLGAPLVGWPVALELLRGARPDVRELGWTAARRLADEVALQPDELRALFALDAVRDAPDAVHALLTAGRARPAGYRAPGAWTVRQCADALDALPEPGFQALRRALLAWEEQGGLDPALALELVTRPERRTRALGLELLGAAQARGALDPGRLADLAGAGHEDVIAWVRERLAELAGAGRLVGSSRVDLQACKLEYSIVSPK